MLVHAHIERVRVAFVYVDHKEIRDIVITRSEVPALKAHFDKEHRRMNADKDFKPIPNEFCKWCDANKAQCAYSRKLK